jgi:hypothetical protein
LGNLRGKIQSLVYELCGLKDGKVFHNDSLLIVFIFIGTHLDIAEARPDKLNALYSHHPYYHLDQAGASPREGKD